jgi:hypothetical protein
MVNGGADTKTAAGHSSSPIFDERLIGPHVPESGETQAAESGPTYPICPISRVTPQRMHLSDKRFTRHVKYGFSQFRCFTFSKRRQIITIEEGQTGVRATCALVTSEKLDCSGKPNCRF